MIFKSDDPKFLMAQAEMLRGVAEKYALTNPELAETCNKKAEVFERVAKGIDRLFSAIEEKGWQNV